MSTLIRNIGVLDARQAKPEQIKQIAKMENIGFLAVNPNNKADFLNISSQNIGKILELDDDYKFHVGKYNITRQMLEESDNGLKICMVGELTIDSDIPAELLKAKLLGFYLVGEANVPDELYGVFMSVAKDITGRVSKSSLTGKKSMGNITITDDYLKSLEDGTELAVIGNVIFSEKFDSKLFLQKIKKISVIGHIKLLDSQTELLHKVWTESETCRLKVLKIDHHYVPSGTRLDAFTLMTIDKPVISCNGQFFLETDVTAEIIAEKKFSFDAQGAVYFPKSLMSAMATKLTKDTKGLPYEAGKLEVMSGEQNLTTVRLNAMQDGITLVVLGGLDVDDDVAIDLLSSKIAVLDNYGEITAGKDVASILQSRLRKDKGSFQIRGEEGSEDADDAFDTIIENAGTYTL